MATCHSTSKSFLILQTCHPAFLRFTELWGTSCTHLQTSKMAKLDLVAFNFLAWRMLLWALRNSRGVKPARRGGGRCWYRKPNERRTGGWTSPRLRAEKCQPGRGLPMLQWGGRAAQMSRRQQGQISAGSCRQTPGAPDQRSTEHSGKFWCTQPETPGWKFLPIAS